MHLLVGLDIGSSRDGGEKERGEDKKHRNWKDINPLLLFYEAYALPLSYNRCPFSNEFKFDQLKIRSVEYSIRYGSTVRQLRHSKSLVRH